MDGFECGWCDRPAAMRDSCTYIGACEATIITQGFGCPAPVITDFNPKSGPIEGGTIITITGRDLGVTFDDFNASSIRVGTVPCTPIREGYVSGRRIQCCITPQRELSITETLYNIEISLNSGQGESEQQFRLLTPEIFEVDPILGPAAGGTRLTLRGLHLNIGNTNDTRITIVDGIECIIE